MEGFVYKQNRRITQQKVEPTAVKSEALSPASILKNSAAETVDPFTLPNGSRVTITSTLNSSPKGGRVATLPYMIAFYQDSISGSNLIASGSSITVTDYILFPTIFLPQGTAYTSGDTPDGNNVVAVTTLSNVSGSDQTITIVIQSRVITGIGSGEEVS